MPDNPDRSHPAGISRRDALRGVLLGAFGVGAAAPAAASRSVAGSEQPTPTGFKPEDTYPTFRDDSADSTNGHAARP